MTPETTTRRIWPKVSRELRRDIGGIEAGASKHARQAHRPVSDPRLRQLTARCAAARAVPRAAASAPVAVEVVEAATTAGLPRSVVPARGSVVPARARGSAAASAEAYTRARVATVSARATVAAAETAAASVRPARADRSLAGSSTRRATRARTTAPATPRGRRPADGNSHRAENRDRGRARSALFAAAATSDRGSGARADRAPRRPAIRSGASASSSGDAEGCGANGSSPPNGSNGSSPAPLKGRPTGPLALANPPACPTVSSVSAPETETRISYGIDQDAVARLERVRLTADQPVLG